MRVCRDEEGGEGDRGVREVKRERGEVLFSIAKFFLSRTRLCGSREAYSSETKKMMRLFLSNAVLNNQLSYSAIESQIEKHHQLQLLDHLDTMLFRDELLVQSWSRTFSIRKSTSTC